MHLHWTTYIETGIDLLLRTQNINSKAQGRDTRHNAWSYESCKTCKSFSKLRALCKLYVVLWQVTLLWIPWMSARKNFVYTPTRIFKSRMFHIKWWLNVARLFLSKMIEVILHLGLWDGVATASLETRKQYTVGCPDLGSYNAAENYFPSLKNMKKHKNNKNVFSGQFLSMAFKMKGIFKSTTSTWKRWLACFTLGLAFQVTKRSK